MSCPSPHRTLSSRVLPALVACPLLAIACGGSAPQGDRADGMVVTHHAANTEAGAGEQMSVDGTVGGLDKRRVQATFGRAFGGIEQCVTQARKRLPYLGGDISMFVAVGSMGKVSSSYLSRSTLGDHRAERCILDVLAAQQWPRPVGGARGEATQSYSFEAPVVEPPHQWTAEQLQQAMLREAEAGESPFAELRGKLDACRKKAGAGSIAVTVYLDEDGMPQGIGQGCQDERGRAAADCIATVMQTTSFPAPGGFFVKTSVAVP